jgi:hypothetical protein
MMGVKAGYPGVDEKHEIDWHDKRDAGNLVEKADEERVSELDRDACPGGRLLR